MHSILQCQLSTNIGPDKRQHKLLNEVLFDNRHLFDVLKKSTILKYRIEGLLFKMFPHHCYRIFKLMKGQIGYDETNLKNLKKGLRV